MADEVKIAFERQVHILRLNDILPSKMLPPALKESAKYKRIAASVAALGLIEPLVVARSKAGGPYMLLDGHVRFSALRDQGSSEARCLIADDDEGFTYNKRVNRLATIQEHYMIVRALDRGVSEEKLARALDVDVKVIRQRRHLLAGISPEVAELLKDKPVGHHALQRLRKMKPIRQLEVAELMVSANNYSSNYARALLATTKPADLLRPDELKKATGLTSEQMARLEREMASVSNDYRELEASYGDDMLVLVIAAGFIERLVSKPEIERFLANHHPEVLDNFRSVIAAASLDQTTAAAA
ncbi:plasmid partitioning protein RepB C-terminal domain-containing protein [Phenylobacterium sp.]|jgi:ParB-like chromosome segregation protein Spo0J|uniref:plasmid partitioning protein RepB C-terminal domain-containing protein n=1 Tax=Phenylobacterium sp. TaxID=1871053 RepID=UPI002F3EB356